MSDQESRPADWDADKYSRVATPQREWSGAVLDRLVLNGDETVMDAGCGSGNVTEDLLAKLPNGRVIGVDGQPLVEQDWRDTVLMAPRQSVDVAFVADNLGEWMFHCHILAHAAGGMMGTIAVE